MEGGGGRREELGGVTLASVLEKEKDRSLRVNRTLLDIIRQEEPNCRVYDNIIDSHHGSKKSWKIFKDKRRLMRGGDAWAAEVSVPVPVPDVSLGDNMVSTSDAREMYAASVGNQRPALAQLLRARSVSIVEQVQEDHDSGEVQSLNHYLSRLGSPLENDADQGNTSNIELVPDVSDAPAPAVNMSSLDQLFSSMRLSEALAAEREHTQTAVSSIEAARGLQNEAEGTETNSHSGEQVQIDAEATNDEPQVRMSLMDLLEDTDSRQIGWSSYSAADVDYYTENIDEGNNIVEQNCCVCMVRQKGSAFIPCGHTFCRLCSRELWVNRGNCPICNGFILEILDIF